MASLTRRGKVWRCYTRKPDGSRHPIGLGAISEPAARQVASHIGELESARAAGVEACATTRRWCEQAGRDLQRKLQRAGLIQLDEGGVTGWHEFAVGYIDSRSDIKPGTRANLQRAITHMSELFPPEMPIGSFGPADGRAFRAAMLAAGRAEMTVRRSCGRARQIFAAAIDQGVILRNPFAGVPCAVTGNRSRQAFIPAATIEKIIDGVPCPEWRLLIALARWGGLRIPSEALALKWADVDFEGRRFIVRSSKTEAHKDGGVRVVPMFPELAGRFLDCFEAAHELAEHVITRYRDSRTNLRTGLQRYIERAGFEPWPRLWQNLRASRATELADKFPGHVCAAWLGHTEAVADAHYRQTTDAHFDRATATETEQAPPAEAEKWVRQWVRAPDETARTEPFAHPSERIISHIPTETKKKATPTGFEPVFSG